MKLEHALESLPVIAILRGVRPEEAVAVGRALLGVGVRAIEVPLNSPAACESIARLAGDVGDRAIVGAGTVLAPDDLRAAADAGARFIVAPDTNAEVIAAALESGLEPVPGIATPTEAFAARRAGARWLKLFPADVLSVNFWRALRAVLPTDTRVAAVGGIDATNARAWLDAGVAALGDEALTDLALADASALLGTPLTRDALLDSVRTSWRDAPSHALIGRDDRVARLDDALAEMTDLVVTGSWVSGTGLASVVPHAIDAAARIRRDAIDAAGEAPTDA